jgi:hypothetical protein
MYGAEFWAAEQPLVMCKFSGDPAMAISLFGGGAAQPADNTSDIIKNTTTATFVADVIEASQKVPVVPAAPPAIALPSAPVRPQFEEP